MGALIARAEDALQGEPARFISYGAALVVWGVVLAAHALGYSTFAPGLSLDDALLDATAAQVFLTEVVRHFVFSPATVAAAAAAAPDAQSTPVHP
jgi:hypothetical protein